MDRKRQMKLAVYATSTGSHVAGWRHPDAAADIAANARRSAEMARIAESGRLDFIFLADSLTMRGTDWDVLSRGSSRYVGQFEPVTLLSALAMVTERIGLIATASTTYEEPYNLARKFASLDLLSGGRAGWNLVTSSNENEAPNFSKESHLAHAERYERAHEFATVVKGLWETWEDDAFPRDKGRGRFFDPAKMHLLNHKGRFFSVRGPLNVPRSPQGHTVIVQAGASDPGKELAAETAEVIFSSQPTLQGAKAFYRDVKGRMAKYGRKPEELLIFPGVSTFVGRSEAEAREKFEALQSLIDPVVGRSFLEMLLGGFDLSGYPVDGPLPDLPETNSNKSSREKLMGVAHGENLTIRQLYMRIAAAKGGFSVIGTPQQIADQLEARFLDEAADGFIFMPAYLPGGLADFTTLVVPELQRRGLFRTEYEGRTLRENLGLPFPQNSRRGSAAPVRLSAVGA